MMKDIPETGCREIMQVNLFGDAISCAARMFCHLLAVGLLVETFVELNTFVLINILSLVDRPLHCVLQGRCSGRGSRTDYWGPRKA